MIQGFDDEILELQIIIILYSKICCLCFLQYRQPHPTIFLSKLKFIRVTLSHQTFIVILHNSSFSYCLVDFMFIFSFNDRLNGNVVH